MLKRRLLLTALALGLAAPVHADAVSEAMDLVAKHAGEKRNWDGPTTGPPPPAAGPSWCSRPT